MHRAADYIEAHSDLQCGETLPRVEYMRRDILQIEYYGPQAVAQAEVNDHYLAPVHAMYDPLETRMVLPDDFELETHEYMVVHEMVHHCQYREIAKPEETCGAMLEREAYRIHELWLDEHDKEGVRHDPLWLMMAEAHCKNPHGPY